MAKKSVYLPPELITEILLRMSVKTILSCRCVRKSWLSLISNPDFATSHFELAASTPDYRLMFLENYAEAPETISIDIDASLNDDSSYSLLSLNLLRLRSCSEIVGSCRGFLLLNCDSYLYLWNPSTGVHKYIPASPITIAYNYHFFFLLYGFGYDPSTDDYLVVLGSYKLNYDPTSIDIVIFSLRANNWKQIELGSYFPYVIKPKGGEGPRAGFLLNEVIHWFAYDYDTSRYAIIAFDLKETMMSEIALPDEFMLSVGNSTSSMEYDLLELGGLISAWTVDKYTIEIWVMKEYKVHSSWTKILHFSLHTVPEFSPLCFTNCGDIVGTVRGGGLVKLNDKGMLLEHHSNGNYYFDRSQMMVYTESLLSHPSGT